MLAVGKTKIIISLLLISLLVSGCSLTFQTSGNGKSLTDGGVFKSINSGASWRQQTLVATVSGSPLNFNQLNVIFLTLDPQDRNAVYAGTDSDGLFYSYDAGASWTVAKTLGKRYVADIAVSPRNKCLIYAASENRIFKSSDCSRSWQEMYFDNDPKARIYGLAADPRNEKIIYAATSRGEVIASADYGQSWTTLKRFSDADARAANAAFKILIDHNNPNNFWVATVGSGVYRTSDRGKTWTSYKAQLSQINVPAALNITDMALASSDSNTLIISTKAGLIRTNDNGAHWQVMTLVPPADKTAINAVAIYPKDKERIYYITNTSLGWTQDGGKTWTSKKLPSSRAGVALNVDSDNPEIIYLGAMLIEPKK
ncbi:MAG: YCF48-related protein [Patescibacteria group bacterium]